MIRLAIAPDLMEEAVLLAERQAPPAVSRAFRRERDRIYRIVDPDAREARFEALHLRWFARFGLKARLASAVNGHARGAGLQACHGAPFRWPAGVAGRLADGRVIRATARAEEGADLVDAVAPGPDGRPLLVIRLRPMTLVDPATLRALLRHELTHVADMLDPAFGYQRALPPSDDGPQADTLLRDRYRVVWDVTIDGRLARDGAAHPVAHEARWREFHAAFAAIGVSCSRVFDRWWSEPRPTHAKLLAFAQAPAADT
jgi:hypothetical protein